MGDRHWADHITTQTGEEIRVEIHDSSFSGDATKLKGTGSGWASRTVQQLDVREPLSDPIQKSEVSASVWVRNSSLIDDIFSSEEGRFTIVYKKDSVEKFEGTILPDLCDYDYLEDGALWKLNLKAKDLSVLEGEEYQFADGRETIIEVLSSLLPYGKSIRTRTSWIVDGETPTDDYLRQVYIDKYALREYARTGDESDEELTNLRALEWVLKSNGLVLKQENGWVLDHITAFDTPATVLESTYNSSGVFQSASTVDLTATGKIVLGSPYNHNPGIKSARLKYDHRTDVSGIQFPQRVELEDPLFSVNDTQPFLSDGTQDLIITAEVEAFWSQLPENPISRVQIEVSDGATNEYWNGAAWQSTSTFVETDMDVLTLTSARVFLNIQATSAPSFASQIKVTLQNAIDDSGAADTTIFKDTIFNIQNPIASENSTSIDYKLTQTGSQSVKVNYGSIYFGDGPTGASRGAISTDVDGDNITISDWARRDDGATPTYINHAHVLLREILDVQRRSRKRISATIKSSFDFDNIISYDGTNYYVLGGSYNGYTGVSSVELLEINIQTATDEFEDLPKFNPELTGTSSPSTGEPTGGITESEADALYARQDNNLSDLNSASAARTALSLVPGTDVQAHSSTLDDLASSLTATPAELNRLDGTLPTVRTNLGLGSGDDVTFSDITGVNGSFSGNLGVSGKLTSISTDSMHQLHGVSSVPVRILEAKRTDGSQVFWLDYLGANLSIGVRSVERINIGIDVDLKTDLLMNATEVIDTSRNFFGANADFTGTLDVDGNATFNANLDVLGLATVDSLDVATTSVFGGLATFDGDILYKGSITSDNFSSAAGLYTGADLSQDTLRIETIRANELRVKAFVAEVSAALYGEDVLTKSRGVVSRDFTVPTTSDTLYVEDLEGLPNTAVFENGDWVRLTFIDRSGGGLETGSVWGNVTNYTDLSGGEQSWTFTRDSGTVGDVIYAGSVAIDYGTSGDSVIVRSVIGDNTPRDTQLTWVTDPSDANNYTIVTRVGNLGGIPNTSGTGFYGNNTFLTGTLLVGDLSKAGNYLEYGSGTLTLEADVFSLSTENLSLNSDVPELTMTLDGEQFFDLNVKNLTPTSAVSETGGDSTTEVVTGGGQWTSPYEILDFYRNQMLRVELELYNPDTSSLLNHRVIVEIQDNDQSAFIEIYNTGEVAGQGILTDPETSEVYDFEVPLPQAYKGSTFGGGIRIRVEQLDFNDDPANVFTYNVNSYSLTTYETKISVNRAGIHSARSNTSVFSSKGVTGRFSLDLPKYNSVPTGALRRQLYNSTILVRRGSTSTFDVVHIGNPGD